MSIKRHFVGNCHDVKLVNGITGTPTNIATQANLKAICGTQCATYLKLGPWGVCALADGQIDGPGHGGNIEVAQQEGYACAVVCIGSIID